MKTDPLIDAIGEIRSDLVQDAEEPRKSFRLRKVRKCLLTAALAAVLLVGTASAEITSGTVSNLLAPLYGGAQTEIVDNIGIPVGVSATVEGYTITADAVIGDRYNISVVYTLTREDGKPLPEGILSFADHSNSVQRGSGGGYLSHERSEDGLSLQMVEEWTSSAASRIHRNATVVFQNLVSYDGETGEYHTLVEGNWELKFTIRYKDTTVEVPVHELNVTGETGYEYQIHELFLSPLGIHMELTAPNTITGDAHSSLMPDFTVSVLLTDDTVVELTHSNRGGGGDQSKPTIKAHYGSRFEEPIPLDTIASLVVCNQTIPVTVNK